MGGPASQSSHRGKPSYAAAAATPVRSHPSNRLQAASSSSSSSSSATAKPTSSRPAGSSSLLARHPHHHAASSSVRSRGQLARRESYRSSLTDEDESTADDSTTPSNKAATRNNRRRRRSHGSRKEKPVLGGLTMLDLVFVAVAYGVNLLRTLGLAELGDVVCKGLWYAVISLPFDFYHRWMNSHPPLPPEDHPRPTKGPSTTKPEKDFTGQWADDGDRAELSSWSSPQLSPFHHLVILLTHFACSNFPHLVPRVLFAEETMLPFVGWRTGGASWSLMKEISGKGWKAIWMGGDAYQDIEERRGCQVAKKATTVLYLHGGGFSLGSVSFYSEALLRILSKVVAMEAEDLSSSADLPVARCIAVEYDLAPAARFPGPLLQCLRCYAHLIEVEQIDPESITFAGDSAGGNLAMAMLLALTGQGKHQRELRERDWCRLPLPGKAVLISPWVDLRPKKAMAFANLRQPDSAEQSKQKQAGKESSATLTDSLAEYEWDYVCSETLLHFAQVYAGILPTPRRVMGPLGWLSNLCGVLSQGLEAENEGKARRQKRSASSAVVDPARKLARAVQRTLDQPLFEKLSGVTSQQEYLQAQQGEMKRHLQDDTMVSKEMPGFTSGLAPMFAPGERKTEMVGSTSQLYAPFEDLPGQEKGSDSAHNLDTNPLLSPILGDWSKVQLSKGGLVLWGERERLSADICHFVDLVRSGLSPAEQAEKDSDAPRQDGQEERERLERQKRGQWLQTFEEKGPGGVHAWPFVAMYLAGEDQEREKGLERIARFIAKTKSPTKSSSTLKGLNIADSYETPGQDRLDYYDEDSTYQDSHHHRSESPPGFVRSSSAGGRAFTREEYQEALGIDAGRDWQARPSRHQQHDKRSQPNANQGRSSVTASKPSVTVPSATTTPQGGTTRSGNEGLKIETRGDRGRSAEPARPLWYWEQQQQQPEQQGKAEAVKTPTEQQVKFAGQSDRVETAKSSKPIQEDPQTRHELADDSRVDEDDDDLDLESSDEEAQAAPSIDPTVSSYGLSYLSQRPSMEDGLSDIAEEGSSITITTDMGAGSSTFSPPRPIQQDENLEDEENSAVFSPIDEDEAEEERRQLAQDQDEESPEPAPPRLRRSTSATSDGEGTWW